MPTYTGTTGNNTLSGSTGADTLIGLAGNDTYIVNHLGDVVVEESAAGLDTILTSVLDGLATYSLEPWLYVENLSYTGTLASLLKGNDLSNVIRANSATATADTLYGGAGNDSLFGFGGADNLVGGTGNDSLDGGTNADTMIGGAGNDVYAVDSTSDRVYEYGGGGFDTVISAVAKDLRVPWLNWVEGLTYNGTAAATLHGNFGANTIRSLSSSADVLNGYSGNDSLTGGGTDTLVGGTGNDFYFASSAEVITELVDEGIDTLVGTKTDLTITALATTFENLFHTGTGNVAVKGNALANVLSGGAGRDTVTGADGNDTVLGGAGIDSVSGGNGNDVLYGGGNNGFVYVTGQRLVTDTSADTLNGGAGNDRYLIDNTQDVVVESTSGGTRDVVISTIDTSLARFANVEALVLQPASTPYLGQGTAGNNILVGNEFDNFLVGAAGNDTLSGFVDVANTLTPQSDALYGDDGNDTLLAFDFDTGFSTSREVSLFGGAGNDLYVLGMRVDGYGGQDTAGTDTAVVLGNGSIDNIEGVENVWLYGADASWDALARAAINTVFGAANFDAAYGGGFDSGSNATGNALANRITGNTWDNSLVGGAGNDTLTGNAGNDTLEGGTGVDSLVGGAGNDTYYLDTGDIAIEAANAGFDTLASLTISSFTGYANFEGLQFLGSAAVNLNRGSTNTSADFLGGGSGRDTISGFGGNDTLDGGAGADSIVGGAGNDSLRGGTGNDSVLGGSEDDSIDGGDGADELAGDLGDDTIEGGAGNDLIDGGGNWDRINGGAGDDSAVGGDGNDTLHGGDGDDVLYGQNNGDDLIGGAGTDELRGGGVAPPNGPDTSAHGDHLWGDEQFGTGGGVGDLFVFDTVTFDNAVTETFTGSGQFEFVGGATIGDFEAGLDAIVIAKEFIGNLDTTLDAPATTTSAGQTFPVGAEIVFVRANVSDTLVFSRSSFFDDIDATAIDAVIGNATTGIALNTTKLFVVDDGSNSAVFLFQSANDDAVVTMDELFLLTVVTGQSTLTVSDFALF